MLPFVGPSYTLPDRAASSQRAVNLYLQIMETLGKAQSVMQVVPGCELFANMGPADAPPPPPPPPAPATITLDFDFEELGTDPEDMAEPNDLYASANYDGYSVAWSGTMRAQNTSGSTVDSAVGFDTTHRAILGEYIYTNPGTGARIDITPAISGKEYMRVQVTHMNGFDFKFFNPSGGYVGRVFADLALFETWIYHDSGWVTLAPGTVVSYMTISPPQTNMGRIFLDDIIITFADEIPP